MYAITFQHHIEASHRQGKGSVLKDKTCSQQRESDVIIAQFGHIQRSRPTRS